MQEKGFKHFFSVSTFILTFKVFTVYFWEVDHFLYTLYICGEFVKGYTHEI